MELETVVAFLEDLTLYKVLSITGQVLAIIAGAWLLLALLRKLIRGIFNVGRLDPNKRDTLVTLSLSVTRYLTFILAGILLIKVFVPTLNLGPLLAGAGVVGLAIGFGAQSLIKDLITGFFIMFEDQLRVGDYVQINDGVTGTVEEVGLRFTALREWSGKKYYIANSEIRTIRNYNRRELRAIIHVTFPFEEDPVRVRRFLEDICKEATERFQDHLLRGEDGHLLEPPQVYGVTDVNDNGRGGEFTIMAKTKPESLWTVEKGIRELIWERSLQRGLTLAYPRYVYEYLATPRAQNN